MTSSRFHPTRRPRWPDLSGVDPTEIKPGQTWVSKADGDDVIVISGRASRNDGWTVRARRDVVRVMDETSIVRGYLRSD